MKHRPQKQHLWALGCALAVAAGATAAQETDPANPGAQTTSTSTASTASTTDSKAMPAPSSTACLSPSAYQAPQLYGAWKIELTGTGQTGHMQFRQHPEFTESLRGELRYGSIQSIASGDLEEGELNLDESSDRVSLTATWTGKLVPGSCGKEIRGEWHDLDKDVRSPFVLRREAGW